MGDKKIEVITLLGLMASCLLTVGFWAKKAPNNPNLMGTMKLSPKKDFGGMMTEIKISEPTP